MSTTSKTSFGTSPVFLLFLVFLTLKLCGVIEWSWWWVTAPLWAVLIMAMGFLALVLLTPRKVR